MSDLISRSELLNAMNTWDKFGCDCHSGLVRIDNTNNEEYVPFVHYEDMVNCVKNIPTAYDVDKVVEELEEAKHEICLSDDDLEHYQNGIDNAIEIVKQGGVSGASEDICEWKLKNVCYTTSIKHYYSLPTPIVKTFNNCPYCGKKIKVVE